MIPAKTITVLGAQIGQMEVADPEDEHFVLGSDLNHLRALAMRLDRPEKLDLDERRDWANWLHQLISGALNNSG